MPPLDFFLPPLVYGVLIPAAAALVLLLPVRFCRETGDPEARAFGALATAAGFVAGCAALTFSPLNEALHLAPLNLDAPWHWSWLALVAAAVGGSALPTWMRALLWPGVAALAAWWLVPANFPEAELEQRNWYYAAVSGSVLLLGALAPLVRRRPGPLVPLLLSIVAGSGALVIHTAGYDMPAHLAGVLAAVLGAVVVMALFAPHRPIAAGAVLVLAALLPGLLALAKFHGSDSVPLTNYVLVAAAPLGLLLPELPGLRSLPGWFRAILRMLAVLGLLAAPLIPAVTSIVEEIQAAG